MNGCQHNQGLNNIFYLHPHAIYSTAAPNRTAS